jgi:hypothetical protein
VKEFSDIGGGGLLHLYNNSPSHLLSKLYPDYDWLPWKFTVCPHNFWDNESNQRKFMDWASNELKIKAMSDWYSVTFKVNRAI